MVAMETNIKILHIKMHFIREVELFCKKCSCIVFSKTKKKYGTKHAFPKKSKRGYKRLVAISFRHVSIERIQTSISIY
jgi:hypothetical protein